MRRLPVVLWCAAGLLVASAQAQNVPIEPVRVPAGTVLNFHLQTRLNPGDGDAADALPKGTVLQVKMQYAVDSAVERDGAEFRGTVVSAVVSGNDVIIHPDSEVRGILVLLRSRMHPEGFRYELLLTGVNDHGKSYPLTASLNSSFRDPAVPDPLKKEPEGAKPAAVKAPVDSTPTP
jgi:hypothetical protein